MFTRQGTPCAVTLDTWSSEIDAFISVTLEDFEAARLFALDSDELDGDEVAS